MKLSAYDWEDAGGKIKVTVKRGVKLKKENITYRGQVGQECNAVWRKCPHGVYHPEDQPYHTPLGCMSPSKISKILCKHGCFKVSILP